MKQIKQPLLIAGPCAAESEIQLMATARELSMQLQEKAIQLLFFRVGIWKPRSHPYAFKGAGKEALPWLQQIQHELGFKVCVEVAKPEQFDLCEQYGIKVFWTGARTAVNPFTMDELAEAARNRDLTILVKNPIIPDMKLWIGSIERFRNANVKEVMAIHRGVSDPNESVLRNAPVWEMPIELKVHFPELPLICDASHIAGKREYLRNISQVALNLGFDGLMLETHINPSQALSDAEQQVTPKELTELFSSLSFREKAGSVEKMLRKERSLIEHIDIQISHLLRKRMEVVDHIAKIKQEHNLPIVDPRQFKKVTERYQHTDFYDEEYELFIKQYLDLLHQSSIQRQHKYE